MITKPFPQLKSGKTCNTLTLPFADLQFQLSHLDSIETEEERSLENPISHYQTFVLTPLNRLA